MPDRVIRDELLTSERYWSVGVEAQRLFIHLLLCADALGRYSGKNYTIRAACYPGHPIDPKLVEKLLSDLQDADLVRIYNVEDERYLFIPRYRQRVRAKHSYFPKPPKQISDLTDDESDMSQTHVQHVSAEQNRTEQNRTEQKARQRRKSQTSIPPDFTISQRVLVWAEKRNISNLDAHLEYFVGRAKAKDYTYVDWDEAFMEAVRKDWAGIGDGRRKVAL